MNKIKVVVFLAVAAIFLSASTSGALAAKKPVEKPSWAVSVDTNPYTPGQYINLSVQVVGVTKAPTSFDFKAIYGGSWWGGGSGPAYNLNGYSNQYWMECGGAFGYSCNEYWKGVIPASKKIALKEVVVIPLNTSRLTGTFTNAITVEMTLNGVKTVKTVSLSTK